MSFIPFRREGQMSLRDLQEEMNGLLARLWHTGVSTGPFDGQDWAPVMDVLEEDDRYVIRAEIPGLDAGAVELTYSGGTLVIKGHKDAEYTDDQRKSLIHHERRFGAFSRSVSLPAEADPTKVNATCHNGLLEITLLKKEASRPKTIKIQVAE
ncbi:MAG TPA: Hsp20/alpha crystallin family protein [Phycisphaerae bacterium]|nr:Hsp20/alpha crystallin family protein [Phycisphaerae bacterium]